MEKSKSIIVGVTGASGSIYAERFIELATNYYDRIYLIFTESGAQVSDYELKKQDQAERLSLKKVLQKKIPEQYKDIIRVFDKDDLWAPCASGTSVPDAMAVLPCSMGTLARIASGFSSNLLERSADVILKQRKQLVVCPREAPFNRIHLENMLRLHDAGATMLPLMPGFYNHPESIDDIVDFMCGRLFELLGVDHKLYKAWSHRRL